MLNRIFDFAARKLCLVICDIYYSVFRFKKVNMSTGKSLETITAQ